MCNFEWRQILSKNWKIGECECGIPTSKYLKVPEWGCNHDRQPTTAAKFLHFLLTKWLNEVMDSVFIFLFAFFAAHEKMKAFYTNVPYHSGKKKLISRAQEKKWIKRNGDKQIKKLKNKADRQWWIGSLKLRLKIFFSSLLKLVYVSAAHSQVKKTYTTFMQTQNQILDR